MCIRDRILCILFGINEIKNDMFELYEPDVRRWESAFFSISEIAFLVNNIGEVICTNENASAFFSASEKSMKDIIEGLDYAASNSQSFVTSINHAVRWFDVKITIYGTKKRFTNYLLLDITERKRLEAALFNEKTLSKTTLESIGDC